MLEAYVWCMVSNNDNTYNQILLENYNQLIVKKERNIETQMQKHLKKVY